MDQIDRRIFIWKKYYDGLGASVVHRLMDGTDGRLLSIGFFDIKGPQKHEFSLYHVLKDFFVIRAR